MEKKDKKWMLTNSEMQVMQILWSLPEQRGFASDIMQGYTDRRPALTTLLTFLKILQEKGFVVAEKEGRFARLAGVVLCPARSPQRRGTRRNSATHPKWS